jgi:hypothetical protein
MATATEAADTPADHDPEKPNHMIFWLDVTIGNPKEYVHLKKAFGSNTDPRCETWTMLTDEDYDTMLVTGDAVSVTFEGVEFLLQAFNNEDACLVAFEENQDKHIFFITSGSMGKSAVPKIMEKYRNIFTDPITDEPYRSVYVFCHNIEYHMEWGMNYLEYVQMFDFDSELLERMTRDIAEYFIERSGRLRQGNDLKGARQRLHWAKKLWHQYDKMQQKIVTDNPRAVRVSQRMNEINELIRDVELALLNESADDDKVAESSS